MNKNLLSSTYPTTALPKCPTGIQGLDEITDGGLPRGRPSLARKLPARARAFRAELLRLRDRLERVTEEVRRIARLPAAVETALYRILRETLRNVEEHAHARHVTVCLRQLGHLVQLAVTDDGIGFDPNRHPASQKGPGSLGLLGMLERTTSLGGALEVQSAPGRGTTIRAQIPFDPGTLVLAHT